MLMLMDITARIFVLSASGGFVVYLASIAWLFFDESGRSTRRRRKPAPEPAASHDHRPTVMPEVVGVTDEFAIV
jgi:hypothetical protein